MKKSSLFTFKVLLLGGTLSGKTCLLNKYIENIYKKCGSTIGIDFKVKTIKFDYYEIKLKIWDTAGQEKFRSITKKYYKGFDGVIFNFNITDKRTFIDLEYFKKGVAEEKGYFESIICANSCDLEERREIAKEEIQNYEKNNQIKVFETSAKSGKNINEAFNYLIYLMLKQKGDEKILRVYENWRNNQIYPSIFLVALQIPDINLFEKIYTFNVKGKNITLNLIYNDCFYKIDGFIFFCDLTNEESIEYILKKINAYKEYSLNKKSIIITYQGKKNKELTSDGKCNQLNSLYEIAGEEDIDIFDTIKQNNINYILEDLINLIIFGKKSINISNFNELKKYINF